jgi:hypothetical protein
VVCRRGQLSEFAVVEVALRSPRRHTAITTQPTCHTLQLRNLQILSVFWDLWIQKADSRFEDSPSKLVGKLVRRSVDLGIEVFKIRRAEFAAESFHVKGHEVVPVFG